MTNAETEAALIDILARIAPEARGAAFDHDGDLREELELDSMDFLRFVQGIAEKLGVTIPEADYAKVFTLRGATSYVVAARGG